MVKRKELVDDKLREGEEAESSEEESSSDDVGQRPPFAHCV